MNICNKTPVYQNLHRLEGRLFEFNCEELSFSGIGMLCQTSAGVWTLINIKSGNRIKESKDIESLLALCIDVTEQYCLTKVK